MQDLTELTTLSRVTTEIPDGLQISMDDFQEGWNRVLSGDVHWLDREIRRCGWHFVWIAEPSVRSGVGKTAQAAIAGALKLALRGVLPSFNAANIDHIDLTEFPWFFLAKVRVYPYQIQQDTAMHNVVDSSIHPTNFSGELPPVGRSLVATVAP